MGCFLIPPGQSILSNLLVVSGLFGLLNYFVGGNKDVFFIDRRLIWVFIFYAAVIMLNRLIHGDQCTESCEIYYMWRFFFGLYRAIKYC